MNSEIAKAGRSPRVNLNLVSIVSSPDRLDQTDDEASRSAINDERKKLEDLKKNKSEGADKKAKILAAENKIKELEEAIQTRSENAQRADRERQQDSIFRINWNGTERYRRNYLNVKIHCRSLNLYKY